MSASASDSPAGRKRKRRERVEEALRLVELQDYADTNVQDLSGGQQQRVALARSLVMEPELLLLDEPFSALDAFTRASLQRDVRSIAKRLGFNLIIVTHDIDEAVLMADRALIMAGAPGKIVHEFEVPLDDPRQRQDPAVQAMRARLLDAFHNAAAGAGSSRRRSRRRIKQCFAACLTALGQDTTTPQEETEHVHTLRP
jgi:ABC-type nitrate/sulfonate/bicarbonate transport system ATPase subunit